MKAATIRRVARSSQSTGTARLSFPSEFVKKGKSITHWRGGYHGATHDSDLTERKSRAVDPFDAKKVQRVHDSDGVDDAVDCPYLVKMHLRK